MKWIIVGLSVVVAGSGCAPVDVDDRATEVVQRLGPMCKHFDFQTKQAIGDGEVRPVFCSEVDDDADHPHFTLYVFSDDETMQEWLQLPRIPGEYTSGDGWAVESDEPQTIEEVKERLKGS